MTPSNDKPANAKPRIKVGEWKTAYKGRMYEVQEAEAVYPNGEVRVFERLTRIPSVWVMPINDNKELIMTKEYRYGPDKYMWFLTAGLGRKDEKPEVTAQRELREEIGLKAGKLELFRQSRFMGWHRFAYVATNLSEAPLPAHDAEDITPVPMPLDEAMELVLTDEVEDDWVAFLITKLYHQRETYGL